MSHDYLREIDLNPPAAIGPPVTSPLDPRAMHYFGFLANGQEISIVPPFQGQPRVAASFHYGNQPTVVPPQPQPPIDAILDTTTFPPLVRYEVNHDRSHVLVWLDNPLPPIGQPVLVRVRAWARE